MSVLEKCFADRLTDRRRPSRLREVIPTYGIDLRTEAEACRRSRQETAHALGMQTRSRKATT